MDSFRKKATGGLALMLNHPNPEIVLSQLDLFSQAARQAVGPSFRDNKADEALGLAFSDGEIPDDYWQSEGHKDLWYATEARFRLLDCLENFFRWRHYEDSKPERRKPRDYLHSLLSGLIPGDAVITLNWDTSIERTLGEQGLWTPMTGYGFDKDLWSGWSRADAKPLPPELHRESAITVLKLHGSVGWHLTSGGGRLFQSCPTFCGGSIFTIRARSFRSSIRWNRESGPDRERVLAYPSFLKQLVGPEMQRIWYLAGSFLGQAESVEFYGYSLPESDLAVEGAFGSAAVPHGGF
jgi:hypothetical protein